MQITKCCPILKHGSIARTMTLHLAGDNQAIDPAQIAHRLAEIPNSQSAAIPFTPRDPAITLKRI
jgi:hypothetical protein